MPASAKPEPIAFTTCIMAATFGIAAHAARLDLAELTGDSNRVEEIPATTPIPATTQRSSFEVMNELEKLRQEVRQLHGALEEQAHQLEQAQKRQQKTLSDFDKRLRTIEGGAPKDPSTAVVVPGSANEPNAQPNIENAESKPAPTIANLAVTPTVAAASSKAATAQQSPDANTTRTPGSEQEAYDQSFNLLKLGRYDESISGFRSFLNDYPSSKYVDSALYWLGETYYVKNQYEQAIAEYSRLVKDYPNSQRLTQALLKIGYSYHELGQSDKAVETLEGLRQRHPSSTAARLAEERLRRIHREQQ